MMSGRLTARSTALGAVLVLVSFAGTARAQTAPFADPFGEPETRIAQAPEEQRRARGGHQEKRDRIRDRIRAMRAWKLTEALELDEQTAARLFPILSRYDERYDALAAEAAAASAALRKELEAEAPRAPVLDRRMNELAAAHDKLHAWQRERFAAVRRVLTPAQAAKMLVLLPEIDQEVRREIRRAVRDGKKRSPRRRGPGRPGDSLDPFR
jgi:hypothetical protein